MTKKTINILVENGCVVEVDLSSFSKEEREDISINIMDLDIGEEIKIEMPLENLNPASLSFIA